MPASEASEMQLRVDSISPRVTHETDDSSPSDNGMTSVTVETASSVILPFEVTVESLGSSQLASGVSEMLSRVVTVFSNILFSVLTDTSVFSSRSIRPECLVWLSSVLSRFMAEVCISCVLNTLSSSELLVPGSFSGSSKLQLLLERSAITEVFSEVMFTLQDWL